MAQCDNLDLQREPPAERGDEEVHPCNAERLHGSLVWVCSGARSQVVPRSDLGLRLQLIDRNDISLSLTGYGSVSDNTERYGGEFRVTIPF